MIRFAHPAFLWLLALLPLLALWRGRKGESVAVEYSSADIVRQVARKRKNNPGAWLSALRLLALSLGIIALARPQLGRSTTEVQSSGIDLILAVDVSGSMEAMDFKLNNQPTSRVEVVKSVVAQFIKDRPSDRISLLAFAGRPYLVSPLTLDHDWLLQNLDRMRIGVVEDGTAIGSVIASSVNRLRDQNAKSRVVILLTDGINNAGKVAPLTAADAARAMGIRIYTIGAGTEGKAPIPVVDMFGRKRLAWAQVDIDEETLRKIADATGGHYFRAMDTDSLRAIYREIDQMEKTTRTMKKFESFRELFAFALVPCLFLLGAELGLAATFWRRLP
ncbi:MAG: VWA domain-containing protein [bacterium]